MKCTNVFFSTLLNLINYKYLDRNSEEVFSSLNWTLSDSKK